MILEVHEAHIILLMRKPEDVGLWLDDLFCTEVSSEKITWARQRGSRLINFKSIYLL